MADNSIRRDVPLNLRVPTFGSDDYFHLSRAKQSWECRRLIPLRDGTYMLLTHNGFPAAILGGAVTIAEACALITETTERELTAERVRLNLEAQRRDATKGTILGGNIDL